MEVERTLPMEILILFVRKYGIGHVLDLVARANEIVHPAEPPPDELPLDQLELSVRTSNCLAQAGIKTVGEVRRMNDGDLLAIKNFGRRSLNEIRFITEHYE